MTSLTMKRDSNGDWELPRTLAPSTERVKCDLADVTEPDYHRDDEFKCWPKWYPLLQRALCRPCFCAEMGDAVANGDDGLAEAVYAVMVMEREQASNPRGKHD